MNSLTNKTTCTSFSPAYPLNCSLNLVKKEMSIKLTNSVVLSIKEELKLDFKYVYPK